MWQNIYYTSSNIFTTRPFESNIFASPALDVYPFLSLVGAASLAAGGGGGAGDSSYSGAVPIRLAGTRAVRAQW